MQINLDTIKTLVETGDKLALEQHILTQVLEKGDLSAAVKANKDIESERDQHVTTSLETWKKNNLKTLIDEEINKRNPGETPEQKRIRELEEKLEKQTKDAERNALKEKALAYMTEKGYDGKFATKYVERFLADDETGTNATLDEFKADFDAIVQSQVEEKLKGANRNPGGGQTDTSEKSKGAQLAEDMKKHSNTQEIQDKFFK